MAADQKANRKLSDYLPRRLEYLEECHTAIEERVYDEKSDVSPKIDKANYNSKKPSIGRILFHLECGVASIKRQ